MPLATGDQGPLYWTVNTERRHHHKPLHWTGLLYSLATRSVVQGSVASA